MTDTPVVKRDLIDKILALRSEVEQRLLRDKYYLALQKLDELIEALRPLESEAADLAEAAPQSSDQRQYAPQPAPEPAPEPAYRWDEPADAGQGRAAPVAPLRGGPEEAPRPQAQADAEFLADDLGEESAPRARAGFTA